MFSLCSGHLAPIATHRVQRAGPFGGRARTAPVDAPRRAGRARPAAPGRGGAGGRGRPGGDAAPAGPSVVGAVSPMAQGKSSMALGEMRGNLRMMEIDGNGWLSKDRSRPFSEGAVSIFWNFWN